MARQAPEQLDMTPTKVVCITDLGVHAHVMKEDGTFTSEARPLKLDEEVTVPRFNAERMRRNRHVVITDAPQSKE